MDFYHILENEVKDRSTGEKLIEVYPDFQVCRSTDLMIRGKKFYAIWDEEAGLWSTDEYDVQRLVDKEVLERARQVREENPGKTVRARTLGNFGSGLWTKFIQYSNNLSDNSHQLDETITFADTEVRKEDYVSKRLLYALHSGEPRAYSEIMATLYSPEDRAKLEWAIGAILTGDARFIQKFIVLYGPAGAGKSTFLRIVESLFEGYLASFDAKALTSSSNAFSTEVFRANPLVAIQHDGDLSRIEDNTKLNSIVSHEDIVMNEKFKASYTAKINAFLLMGSNKAVKITDAKSGLIRRLIDVQPSGRKIPEARYHELMFQYPMELGMIAQHCIDTYKSMGRDYYSSYRPVEMMLQTDVFFNYIDHYYDVFSNEDGITLTRAYSMYKEYCSDALIEYKMPQYRFREELKNYFRTFHDRYVISGERVRSYYMGFIDEHFISKETPLEGSTPSWLVFDETESPLDEMLKDRPAQYSKENGSPRLYWSDSERIINGKLRKPDPSQVCSTTLKDIDTSKEHYVQPPENIICIDFDLKDDDGKKSLARNIEAAARWPETNAEPSKSGSGLHLHYLYSGDVEELSRIFDEGIEIKVFTGDAALRRRLSGSNGLPISTISGGLPLKEKKMINESTLKSEKGLRALIEKNLRKEIHPGTKPSMDFIKKILDDAYASGMAYDVSDMRGQILTFANNSTNQALYCLKLIKQLKLEGPVDPSDTMAVKTDDDNLYIFDTEVYPNLFVVNYKKIGVGGIETIVQMVNPSAEDISRFIQLKIVGFNNRRYDNHILYAASMGYNNLQLYQLSKRIISGDRSALFAAAYGISYADIYDFASKKQSLAKWQIELGLPHVEMDTNKVSWDEQVEERYIPEILDYCNNDVWSAEVVFDHLSADFQARQMIAELSGRPVNDPLVKHAQFIIFGQDKASEYKDFFEYTDLSEMFPGYEFHLGKSSYKDVEEVGEGGYVYAEPGMYEEVAVLDVASMHPTSIIELNLFGKYTKNFEGLMNARLAIKRGDFDHARTMFDGRLAKFLESEDNSEQLSYALKIVINSIYGLTCTSYDNPFRDMRNKDNIVAKRGALFMIDLKEFVEAEGYQVIHIKTDSIKIPKADTYIIDLVMEFGEKYGYDFDHEATYEKMCLVNKAVYIAWVKQGRKPAHWEAVGAQFQHPYVFKKLFTKEPIDTDDLKEAKSVTTQMFLDFTPDDETPMALMPEEGPGEYLKFTGKTGLFVPVSEGGGWLLREKEGKFYSVTGAKDHKWREVSSVEQVGGWDTVDYTYYNRLAEEAMKEIDQYGDFHKFATVEG